MKFKVFGRMRSCPSIKLDTDISPLDFKTSINGHFYGELGPFAAKIGEIPIRMTIPFLKHRPIMISVGGFPVKLDRFQVNVEKAGLDLGGTVGLKGIHASVDSKVDCSTDMDLKGHVAGKVGLSHLDLIEDEEHFEEESVEQKE
jgi:hypothetical protein